MNIIKWFSFHQIKKYSNSNITTYDKGMEILGKEKTTICLIHNDIIQNQTNNSISILFLNNSILNISYSNISESTLDDSKINGKLKGSNMTQINIDKKLNQVRADFCLKYKL